MEASRMSLKKNGFSKKEKDDIRTLMKFAGIYCRENHPGGEGSFFIQTFRYQRDRKERDILVPGLYSAAYLWSDHEIEVSSRSQTHVQEM